MKIIFTLLLVTFVYSCGTTSQKSWNNYGQVEKENYASAAKKLSNLGLCKISKASKKNSDYSKSINSEIRRRSINCETIFDTIAKKEKKAEERRIAALEDDHGFHCKWMKWLSEGTPEYISCLKNENEKMLASNSLKSTSSQNNASTVTDSTIARYQSECKEMGFKRNTDKMAECILRQKEIEVRRIAAEDAYNEEVRKNQAAKELQEKKRRSENMRAAGQLLYGIGKSLQGTSSGNSYSSSSYSAPIQTPCQFKDESQKNFSSTKLCIYDCMGSVHSETISVHSFCPLISYR